MATPVNEVPAQNTGSLTTEKVTYRAYVKLTDKGEIDSLVAKAESANKSNWTKLEAAGNVQWSQNEFTRYIVQSDEGFKLLVPDEAQRLYIVQAGLNYVQNSKANAYMVERKEGDENSPAYNDQTIDLKEAINEPPSKRALTDQQKLERLVKSMGLSADQMNVMFAELAKRFATPSATAEVEVEAESEEVSAD